MSDLTKTSEENLLARDFTLKDIARLVLRKWTPTICVYPNPFKICEFWEIKRGVVKNPKGTLLDLGCGGGLQTVLLGRKFGKAFGVDIDDGEFGDARQRLHRWNRERIQFLRGDLLDLHLPPESINVVVSFSVLEHMENWEHVLREIFRILRTGGHLVLSADSLRGIADESLLLKHKTSYSVFHYFSCSELESALKKIGFRRVNTYPLFRSAFARSLFSQGIRNDFKFNRVKAILYALLLSVLERLERNRGEGLFVVVRAEK